MSWKATPPKPIAKVEPVEAVRRHIVVTLTAQTTLAQAFEDPELLFGQRLRLGDLVDLVAGDGSGIWYACPVVGTDGGIYLGKPSNKVELRPSSLFEDGTYRVVPDGERFAIEHKRGGHRLGETFTTSRAAEMAVHRMHGEKAA